MNYETALFAAIMMQFAYLHGRICEAQALYEMSVENTPAAPRANFEVDAEYTRNFFVCDPLLGEEKRKLVVVRFKRIKGSMQSIGRICDATTLEPFAFIAPVLVSTETIAKLKKCVFGFHNMAYMLFRDNRKDHPMNAKAILKFIKAH